MAGNVVTDTISENTAAAGVTIDSVLVKDGGVTFTGSGGSDDPLNYYREETFTSTNSSSGTGGTTSASRTYRITRIGNLVNIEIEALSVTNVGTSANRVVTDTAMPSWARPRILLVFPITEVYDNGARLATTGMLRVTTAGILEMYRSADTTTNYTNSTAGGLFQSICLTYNVS
jgi:hypothetical protein